jgi:methanogenic corrinoid protein MtbC1
MDQQEQIGGGPDRRGSPERPSSALHNSGAPASQADVSSDSTRARLAAIIENEIIPRLMLAHRGPQGSPLPASAGEGGIDHFVSLVLAPDGEPAYAHVERLLATGVPREALFLDVLAPAARRLGELWQEDMCDFMDVTAGLARLQNILHELSPELLSPPTLTTIDRHVLLATAPGEQHTFGLSMVESFFRSAGWDVTSDPELDPARLVAVRRFGIIGFSLSSETRLEALGAAIRAVRRASRNPSIGVMVGGHLFMERPELVALVGADLTATDGLTAVLLAQSLLDLRAPAC